VVFRKDRKKYFRTCYDRLMNYFSTSFSLILPYENRFSKNNYIQRYDWCTLAAEYDLYLKEIILSQ